jgi:hypothetical protein
MFSLAGTFENLRKKALFRKSFFDCPKLERFDH